MSRKILDSSSPRVLLKDRFTLEVFLDEESREKLLQQESLRADFIKDQVNCVPIELKIDVLSHYVTVGDIYELYLTREQLFSRKQSYFFVNSLFDDRKSHGGNPLDIYIVSNK